MNSIDTFNVARFELKVVFLLIDRHSEASGRFSEISVQAVEARLAVCFASPSEK